MPKKPRIKIWTEAPRPFAMAGDGTDPIGTLVHFAQPFQITSEFSVSEVVNPNGSYVYIEPKSGAIVSKSLDAVRDDIRTGDPKVMKAQIKTAIARGKQALMLPKKEFWNRYNA